MCVGLAKNSGAFVFGCHFLCSFFWASKRKKAQRNNVYAFLLDPEQKLVVNLVLHQKQASAIILYQETPVV